MRDAGSIPEEQAPPGQGQDGKETGRERRKADRERDGGTGVVRKDVQDGSG